MLDTVLIPVSWYVVEEGDNDRVYVIEQKFSGTGHRIATIPPGHYDDMYTMAAGIEEALIASGRMVISPYSVTFSRGLARFQVGNPWTGAGEGCYIANEWTLLYSLDPEIVFIIRCYCDEHTVQTKIILHGKTTPSRKLGGLWCMTKSFARSEY